MTGDIGSFLSDVAYIDEMLNQKEEIDHLVLSSILYGLFHHYYLGLETYIVYFL